MSPGIAALGQAGFAASEDVPQCCRGLTKCTRGILSKPLVQVLGCGKNIIGGSDDEADLASFHFPKILPCELPMLHVFPVSPLALFGL